MDDPQREPVEELVGLFERWKDEHKQLDQVVDDLTGWTSMAEKSQKVEADRFLEAARHLRGLHELLTHHFSKEKIVGNLLAEARGIATPEIEAFQQKADKDHALLSSRLNKLIDYVESAPAQLSNWKSAIQELNLFLDLLEQHEELEAEHVHWLIPNERPNQGA